MHYKQCRTDAKRKNCIAKRTFFLKGKQGTNNVWKHIKQCSGLGRIKQLIHPWPCGLPQQAQASANKMNMFFFDSITSIVNSFSGFTNGPITDVSETSQTNTSLNHSNFDFAHINPSDVLSAIKDLPATNSTGLDNISSKMLKISANAIAAPLANIFNCSLEQTSFPNSWKRAVITPVFKKGDVYDTKNYRPISLLNIVSKCFEKIVCRQLSDFLEENSCLSNAQHGFRRKLSCETALLRLSNILFCAKRRKQFICMTTIDYSKASDCINFDILLKALENCHVSKHALLWFSSYLRDRFQCTKYQNHLSNFTPIIAGVPQSSVLGPVLFAVFVNSLLSTLPSDGEVAYADDVNLICYAESSAAASAKTQSLLNKVAAWSTANRMHINTEKCFYMIMAPTTKHSESRLLHTQPTIGNNKLCHVNRIKILGVTITDDLKWHSHCSAICKKIQWLVRSIA